MSASMRNVDFSKKTVEMEGITKRFGDFTANDGIDLTVHRGEVHALLGENGAGKTTLMKILYGLYRPTAGKIRINGKTAVINGPADAIRLGIGMVHQHFMLVRPFTVTENIVLGKEGAGPFGILDMKSARRRVAELSERYGLLADPDAVVGNISVGMQQRVEILKTLYRGAEILILDEPTAVLVPQEIEELSLIIRNLTAEGKSVILITHKLKEITKTADRCTVIRRGLRVGTVDVDEADERLLASMMVGRDVVFGAPVEKREPGERILRVENLTAADNRGLPALKGLSLQLHRGEILGIAGIDGNGQTEFVETLTGLRKAGAGRILIKDEDVTNKTPREIIDWGLSGIPEDRQKRGLILDFSIAENLILKNYSSGEFSRRGRLFWDKIAAYARGLIARFDIRPAEEDVKAGNLSGGNQQKVIIAREVTNDPLILIAAGPTRGLDVGAVEFVHRALIERRDRNSAVLLVSFDLEEILHLSDRIAVMYEGRIAATMKRGEADEKTLGLLMAGGSA